MVGADIAHELQNTVAETHNCVDNRALSCNFGSDGRLQARLWSTIVLQYLWLCSSFPLVELWDCTVGGVAWSARALWLVVVDREVDVFPSLES